MYGLSAGTKKVAVVERWPFVELDCSSVLLCLRPINGTNE